MSAEALDVLFLPNPGDRGNVFAADAEAHNPDAEPEFTGFSLVKARLRQFGKCRVD
jgi:hypothetical protein